MSIWGPVDDLYVSLERDISLTAQMLFDGQVQGNSPKNRTQANAKNVVIVSRQDWQQALIEQKLSHTFLPPTLVLSDRPEELSVHQLVGLGISGFAVRTLSFEIMKQAILSISEGALWLGPNCWNRGSISSDLQRLSKREIEILILLASARTNQQIAQQLQISLQTVKCHVRQVLNKLEQKDRTNAAVIGVKNEHLLRAMLYSKS